MALSINDERRHRALEHLKSIVIPDDIVVFDVWGISTGTTYNGRYYEEIFNFKALVGGDCVISEEIMYVFDGKDDILIDMLHSDKHILVSNMPPQIIGVELSRLLGFDVKYQLIGLNEPGMLKRFVKP